MFRINALVTYPIKGCAGVSVGEAVVTPRGLAHDRSFMITGEDGVFRTQRYLPRLALIQPDISADGARLTLRAPGADAHDIAVDTIGERRTVDLFGTTYRGIDQGDAVAGWLSAVLGSTSRLVRVPPEHDRATGGATPGTSGYADSGAVHLLSLSSLDHLNHRLTRRGVESLPISRFRPNIVITGERRPHDEDTIRQLTCGDVELGYTKPAARCAVTTVRQETGVKQGPEPLRTLATYRTGPSGGVLFGTKFAVVHTGTLAVGDELVVNRSDAPEIEFNAGWVRSL